MRAKEYLRQLGTFDRAVHRRMKQLADMKADIAYTKGMTYDAVRVQTSPSGSSQTLNQIEEIADLEASLMKDIARLHRLRYKITQEIEQLTDERYRDILIMRYIDGLSLQEIADKIGYSYDYTQHMHGYALLAFERGVIRDVK